MNLDGGTDDKSDNNNSRTKAIAAIGMAGIVVAAALLSGLLSLIGSGSNYQPVLAQQDLIGDTTTITTTNATIMGGGGAGSACDLTQTIGGQNATTDATTTIGGDGGANVTADTNVTASTRGGNPFISVARMHIEEACMAAQNNDIQDVMIHLNLALNALRGGPQGNVTTATTAGPEISTGGGGTTEAGTAGDEPGTTEDEPGTTGGDTAP